MSRRNTTMTATMKDTELPLVTVLYDGKETNCMHGLKYAADLTKYRGDLSPLGENRTLDIKVTEYNSDVTGISFEVRSSDGSRLIESTEIYNYTEQDDALFASIQLKDLIDPSTEYSLCIVLTLSGGSTARYYTRVIKDDASHASEMISFVSDFSSLTMDKKAAEGISQYLESDSTGDNSTFARVNIHSNFDQVTWGALQPTRVSTAYIRVLDLADNIGSFMIDYRVSCGIDDKDNYYYVNEYYRVRYSEDRIYLLDFERKMNEEFTGGKSAFANDKIILGIHDTAVEFKVNNAGNAIAFVNDGSLFAYRAEDTRIVKVFSFIDENNDDERTRYQGHGIKVLSIDEGGNIRFLVHGYQNRGDHEGEICAVVYYYDSSLNIVEEEVSVPYSGSADMLESNINRLSFVDPVGNFYLYIDGGVYRINVGRKSSETIASGIAFDEVYSSDSGKIGAYIAEEVVGAGSEKDAGDSGNDITLLDMSDGSSHKISSDPGCRLNLLGFIGDDLVYGSSRATDSITSCIGVSFTPMSALYIVDATGNIKKEYSQADIFISSVDIIDSTVDIRRIVSSENNSAYEPIANDQIMSNTSSAGTSTRIITVPTEQRETITEIQLTNEIPSSKLQLLTPDFALYEGSRSVEIVRNDTIQTKGFLVYSGGYIEGTYSDSNTAIKTASEESGFVLNMKNSYVWRKGSRLPANTIKPLDELSGGSASTALYDCMDAVLSYTGSGTSSREAMQGGRTSDNVLAENIDGDVLTLMGISLSDVLYYVSKGSPVIAATENGPVLIVGYDQQNTIIYDPSLGITHHVGMNDSAELFEAAGNEYLTYIQNSQPSQK
ncbi:MAG: hypothetical protein K6G03_06420 [Lachnospiraceae bacterium]|nr:hypothetical protein [Lachnospiraceae bacterium]